MNWEPPTLQPPPSGTPVRTPRSQCAGEYPFARTRPVSSAPEETESNSKISPRAHERSRSAAAHETSPPNSTSAQIPEIPSPATTRPSPKKTHDHTCAPEPRHAPSLCYSLQLSPSCLPIAQSIRVSRELAKRLPALYTRFPAPAQMFPTVGAKIGDAPLVLPGPRFCSPCSGAFEAECPILAVFARVGPFSSH